jgi:hypothetical protein
MVLLTGQLMAGQMVFANIRCAGGGGGFVVRVVCAGLSHRTYGFHKTYGTYGINHEHPASGR